MGMTTLKGQRWGWGEKKAARMDAKAMAKERWLEVKDQLVSKRDRSEAWQRIQAEVWAELLEARFGHDEERL